MISQLKALFLFIRQLLGFVPGVPAPKRPKDLPQEIPSTGEPKWLKIARQELGVKEAPGAANNPRVLKYYADAGFPEVNADSVAWCAAFTGAMLERAGYSSSKSLAARSYMQWGKPVTKPYPGCVAVFSRGDPRGWQGHVGFYVDEDARGIRILAGNQSGDQVSIDYQDRSRLLGYREPITAMNSRTTQAAVAGIVSAGATGTAILDSQTQIIGIIGVLKDLGTTMPQIVMITSALSILAYIAIIAARVGDNREKGR